jgi:hypothetical protein
MKGVVVGAGFGGYAVPHDGCSVIDISIPGHKTSPRQKLKQPSFLSLQATALLHRSMPHLSVQYEACNYVELPKYPDGNTAYSLQFIVAGYISVPGFDLDAFKILTDSEVRIMFSSHGKLYTRSLHICNNIDTVIKNQSDTTLKHAPMYVHHTENVTRLLPVLWLHPHYISITYVSDTTSSINGRRELHVTGCARIGTFFS